MPQYTFEQIRHQWGLCAEAQKPMEFPRLLWQQLGLTDSRDQMIVNEHRLPCLAKERKARPDDFNVQALTEAMLGQGWADKLGLQSPGNALPAPKWLRETGPTAVGPSFFFQVAAWSATVGGLMRAAMLEGYETPEYDLRNMFPTAQAILWQGGERMVDIFGPNLPAGEVGPNEEYPTQRMDSMWVEPDRMRKYGGQLTIAKETAWIDITGGQILQKARTVGNTLAYRENELALDIIVGRTNNFRLGLTASSTADGYNTYNPTINGVAIGNDVVNPMNDWTSFQVGDDIAAAYVHPVFTHIPVKVNLDTLLVPTTLSNWARFLTTARNFDSMNQPGLPVPQPPGGGTFPSGALKGDNPYAGRFQVKDSQWLLRRHIAATTSAIPELSPGLGLSAANARRWYRLDPQKFARRRIAWGANVIDLNPNDYVLAARGIIAGQVGDIAVQYQVVNPWAIQRNRVS